MVHTQHLTEFSAPSDATNNSDEPKSTGTRAAAAAVDLSSTTAVGSENTSADLAWREQIELRTHPALTKFKGCRVIDLSQIEALPRHDVGCEGDVASVDADWNEA